MQIDRMATTARNGALPSALSVRAMTLWDIAEVIALLRQFPSVHFCDWEDEQLLAHVLAQSPPSCFVAHDGRRMIGAIISGVLGTRGTINHIAVEASYRSQGIGQLLLAHVLESFRNAGIRRVFLFVLRNQPTALRFWNAAGFHETTGEVTLERDI